MYKYVQWQLALNWKMPRNCQISYVARIFSAESKKETLHYKWITLKTPLPHPSTRISMYDGLYRVNQKKRWAVW